jgi:hypothetical protein
MSVVTTLVLVVAASGAASQVAAPKPPTTASQPQEYVPNQSARADADKRATTQQPAVIELLKVPVIRVDATDKTERHRDYTDHEWFLVYLTGLLCLITGVLALYTALLFRSTKKIAIDTAKAYISANRPHIIVHAVELREDTDSLAEARVFYINKGNTPASVEEIRAKVIKTSEGAEDLRAILADDQVTPNHPVLESGMKDRFDVAFPILTSGDIPQGKHFYCLGSIAYRDGAGNRRETGFIRFLKRTDESPSGKRKWVRIEGESEYQYEY